MSNIIITGFSGTGKSRVAKTVADLLDRPLVDTDAEIVQHAGKPVSRIFQEDGEELFRSLEHGAVRTACANRNSVIAVGGGAVMDAANRKLMEQSGFVVCLEARPETIYERLYRMQESSTSPEVRPLLKGPDPLQRVGDLKAARQPTYSLASWTIHTDALSVQEVAGEVVRAWRDFGARNGSGGNPFGGRPDLAATVETTAGSCPLLVDWGYIEDQLGELLIQGGIAGPVYVVTDDSVSTRYLRPAQRSLQRAGIEAHVFVFPHGEQSKSLAMATGLYEWLAGLRARRDHTLMALGGGVVGDLTGFVAATYNRGIGFVQVPTSLAAMVDASIGGKTAVNLPAGKNLVGAFYQPRMVVVDVSALLTLPQRETMEGWAEAIKHGLILDRDLFTAFENRADQILSLEPELTTDAIRRSIAIKARVVSEDERETRGVRILLNYGHTIGHGLEAAAGYGEFLHGEAVAVGMTGAAAIGEEMGITPRYVVERQEAVLKRFNLPTRCPQIDVENVESAMSLDKKALGASLRWVLLEDVGRAVTSTNVPREVAQRSLRSLTA